MVLNYLIQVNMILILIVLFIKLIQREVGFVVHVINIYKEKQIPEQAVINKLDISASLDVLIGLNRLERVLISKRILFKRVAIMSKDNFPKLKGSICNVPIDTVDISDVLPREADSNDLVVIKLKRKLTHRGHV